MDSHVRGIDGYRGCWTNLEEEMKEREYVTTKEECEKQIQGVCSGCGGKLEPIETVDNGGSPTFWVGCLNCSCFESGVEPQVYQTAYRLVTEMYHRPYSDSEPGKEDKELYERWLHSQVRGTSRLVREALFMYGLVSQPEKEM